MMESKICCLNLRRVVVYCFFFFQAEDGIRDYKVTGVQTCALPILQALVLADVVDPAHVGVRDLARVADLGAEALQGARGLRERPRQKFDRDRLPQDRKSVV